MRSVRPRFRPAQCVGFAPDPVCAEVSRRCAARPKRALVEARLLSRGRRTRCRSLRAAKLPCAPRAESTSDRVVRPGRVPVRRDRQASRRGAARRTQVRGQRGSRSRARLPSLRSPWGGRARLAKAADAAPNRPRDDSGGVSRTARARRRASSEGPTGRPRRSRAGRYAVLL